MVFGLAFEGNDALKKLIAENEGNFGRIPAVILMLIREITVVVLAVLVSDGAERMLWVKTRISDRRTA